MIYFQNHIWSVFNISLTQLLNLFDILYRTYITLKCGIIISLTISSRVASFLCGLALIEITTTEHTLDQSCEDIKYQLSKQATCVHMHVIFIYWFSLKIFLMTDNFLSIMQIQFWLTSYWSKSVYCNLQSVPFTTAPYSPNWVIIQYNANHFNIMILSAYNSVFCQDQQINDKNSVIQTVFCKITWDSAKQLIVESAD